MFGLLLPIEEIIDHYEVVVKKKHIHDKESFFQLLDCIKTYKTGLLISITGCHTGLPNDEPSATELLSKIKSLVMRGIDRNVTLESRIHHSVGVIATTHANSNNRWGVSGIGLWAGTQGYPELKTLLDLSGSKDLPVIFIAMDKNKIPLYNGAFLDSVRDYLQITCSKLPASHSTPTTQGKIPLERPVTNTVIPDPESVISDIIRSVIPDPETGKTGEGKLLPVYLTMLDLYKVGFYAIAKFDKYLPNTTMNELLKFLSRSVNVEDKYVFKTTDIVKMFDGHHTKFIHDLINILKNPESFQCRYTDDLVIYLQEFIWEIPFDKPVDLELIMLADGVKLSGTEYKPLNYETLTWDERISNIKFLISSAMGSRKYNLTFSIPA